ncbi:MAG: HD domain-containing protein [wastewater metagenome]|nr:HD domain-containing protein [Candidatus Loosdrechtia aerotolerans]
MDEEQSRLLLSGVTDLLFVYDTSGNVVFVNKVFEKFTGYRPEEFYGKPFSPLFNKFNLERAVNAYKLALTGECSQSEISFKNTKILCEYRNFPLRDNRGDIIGVMGIARDITVRKQREEELKAMNELLEKQVVEHSARLSEMNGELVEEMNDHKRIERELKQSIGKLQKSLRIVIHSLASTIELKDAYAAGHQKRVAQLARCIAEEMGLLKSRVDAVSLAATLHDIGKISIPTEVLGKTDQLTPYELHMLKTHPRVSYDILREIEFPYPVAQIVLQHHERMNGSGYPSGVFGKDILLEAKILAVADVIEAMLTPRPYRPALNLDKVLEYVSEQRGILYDAHVVYACLVIFHEKGFRFEPEFNSNIRFIEEVLLKV